MSRNNRYQEDDFEIWNHHYMDRINQRRANQTVSDGQQSVLAAFLALGCFVAAYYTSGPIDKTVPLIFYIFRILFGENTSIGFMILAIIFSLIVYASGTHIDPYKKRKSRNDQHHH